MRFNKIAALGAAAVVAASAVTLTTGAANDNASPAALEKRVYVSKATGKTKITQFVDPSTGDVVAQATGGLKDKVRLLNNSGESFDELGVEIIPEDPLTEAGQARMAAELTPEVRDERRRVYWRQDQMVELPDQASQTAHGVVNRAVPLAVPSMGSMSSNGHIYSEGCATRDADEVYMYGCFQRTGVPDGMAKVNRSADSSWSSGHHKGTFGRIRWIKSKFDYTNGHPSVMLMQANPSTTQPYGSCGSRTFGLTSYGINVSSTSAVCDQELNVNVREEFYMHGWFGKKADDQTWTGSPGNSVVKVEAGESFGFKWQLAALEDDCEMTDPVCGQDSYYYATN